MGMKIQDIESVDFRSSELTVFEEYYKRNKKAVDRFGPSDIVVFVSMSGRQLVFIHGFSDFAVDGNGGARRRVLMSVRYRIVNGTWNPLMLRNYAEACGLQIVGLKKFEEHYKELAQVRAVTRNGTSAGTGSGRISEASAPTMHH